MLSIIHKQAGLNKIWGILMLITFINTVIAENTTQQHSILTLFICASIAIKGPLVADYFMGLIDASPIIRWLVHSYVIGIPGIIAVVIFALKLESQVV